MGEPDAFCSVLLPHDWGLGGFLNRFYTVSKDDTTVQLANGVQVTPVEVKTDDMAQLLDARFWKFKVKLPDPDSSHHYTLLFYRHGKLVQSLGGFGIGPKKKIGNDPNVQITIGMLPNNNDFARSPRINYSLSLDGGAVSGAFANPLQGNDSYSSAAQTVPSENLIYLMSGTNSNSRYGNASMNDTAIAVQIGSGAATVTP